MPWVPEPGVLHSGEASRVTTADVRLCYRVLLGREAEDRAALLAKRSLTFAQLTHGILSSPEFAAEIVAPLAAGADWGANRYGAPVDRRSLDWAVRSLVSDPASRARVAQQSSWTGVLAALTDDCGFLATLSSALGSNLAEQFGDGLRLALVRLNARVGDTAVRRPPGGPGPRISVVIVTQELGVERLAAAVATLLLQSYRRWELVLVDDGSVAETAVLADSLAAVDRRIRIDTPRAGLAPPALRRAGVDLASGDYLCFPGGAGFPHAETLGALAFQAFAQGRPAIVSLSEGGDIPAEPVLVSVTFAAAADDNDLAAIQPGFQLGSGANPGSSMPRGDYEET
jgi:hypothetical protein